MNIFNFSSTFILGFLVILFYFLFLPKNNYAWANIKDLKIRLIILISILLSAISYLIIWIKNTFYLSNKSNLYLIGNIIFLIGAILWPISLHYYPTKFHYVILSLCITSLGALIILINECIDKSIIGIIFAIYLFFHVFFMDNIYWASSYRSLFN